MVTSEFLKKHLPEVLPFPLHATCPNNMFCYNVKILQLAHPALLYQYLLNTYLKITIGVLKYRNIFYHINITSERWAGHVARMGEEKGVYRFFVGKSEGSRPLGRHRRRWVNNIRMDLQEMGCGYMDWTGLAQDRDRWRTLVSAVMNLRVP